MGENISVYLLEDQVAYRAGLKEMIHSLPLNKSSISLDIISIENFGAFYKEIEHLKIRDNDIFLIDIDLQMAYSGLDFAKRIRLKNEYCFIIFLTNLEDKGIEVINLNVKATSYILKGSTTDNSRIKKLFDSIKLEVERRMHNKEGYISFKKTGETIYIKYEDILYIQSVPSVRNTLLVKTIYSEQIIDGALNKIKKEIVSNYFYTGLKSFIINITHIASLNYLLGLVVFDDGSELEVGEKIVYKLKKAL